MVQQVRAMLTILRRVRGQILRRLEKARNAAHRAEAALLNQEEWAKAESEKIDRLHGALTNREDRMERLLNEARREDKVRQEMVDAQVESLAVNDSAWKKMGRTPS